jgi:hypothetical protein
MTRTEDDPQPLESYWHGSAGGEVAALRTETARLRARVVELEAWLAKAKAAARETPTRPETPQARKGCLR